MARSRTIEFLTGIYSDNEVVEQDIQRGRNMLKTSGVRKHN